LFKVRAHRVVIRDVLADGAPRPPERKSSGFRPNCRRALWRSPASAGGATRSLPARPRNAPKALVGTHPRSNAPHPSARLSRSRTYRFWSFSLLETRAWVGWGCRTPRQLLGGALHAVGVYVVVSASGAQWQGTRAMSESQNPADLIERDPPCRSHIRDGQDLVTAGARRAWLSTRKVGAGPDVRSSFRSLLYWRLHTLR
jgi:hypothetical protein